MVPEIRRRYGASIAGTHQRIKSANFADLVSGLKRLRSAPRAAPALLRSGVQAIRRLASSGQREAAVLLPPSVSSLNAADNLRRVVWDLLLQARLMSGDLPPSLDGATKAECKAQERGS